MESTYQFWSTYGFTGALALVVISASIYILYSLITVLIGNRSKKYNFILKNEVMIMMTASIGFALAIGIVVSVLLLNERDFTHIFVFSLKTGMAAAAGLTVGFAARAYLKVYYPFILDRKLSDIRFKPRKHPHTGNLMRLLNEEEEDKYLTEEMIRQEDEFKFDFDVWLDEVTDKTIIETYKGTADRECPRCHFKILKLTSEEIDTVTKKEIKHFHCSYCGHREREEVEK
ncbi:hypothetical protein [Reichenbachiella versicolor]|uniref:hypothetical protein n=1 Tax=Reichenbachiella versicolor TaxID=1821036 RepID=UPI000D6DFF04|nr:hypothetical protein [Reichenbachiella versicolor]